MRAEHMLDGEMQQPQRHGGACRTVGAVDHRWSSSVRHVLEPRTLAGSRTTKGPLGAGGELGEQDSQVRGHELVLLDAARDVDAVRSLQSGEACLVGARRACLAGVGAGSWPFHEREQD